MTRTTSTGAPTSTPINESLGQSVEPGVVRLERSLPGPIERIWSYLVESEQRRRWLAPGTIEPQAGGRVELEFRHAELSAVVEATPDRYRGAPAVVRGLVTRFEPPRVLALTWSVGAEIASEVTFELAPNGAEVTLVLTHRRLPSRPATVSVASGWHAHLEILLARLQGQPAPGFWTTHSRLEREYERRMPTLPPSPPPTRVEISRRFDTSPERVFDAWLQPALIGRWMFGPAVRDEEILHLDVDPTVGGAFSFLVRRAGVEIDHVGRYLVLERPTRLEFTWGILGQSVDESHVVIEIRPLATGCEVRLTHEIPAPWSSYADRTRSGWTHMLEALAKTL